MEIEQLRFLKHLRQVDRLFDNLEAVPGGLSNVERFTGCQAFHDFVDMDASLADLRLEFASIGRLDDFADVVSQFGKSGHVRKRLQGVVQNRSVGRTVVPLAIVGSVRQPVCAARMSVRVSRSKFAQNG